MDGNPELSKMGGLKGKWTFKEFSGTGKDLCRIKEFEFSKGKAPTPNPLRKIDVLMEHTIHGNTTSLPTKSRGDESIKLIVSPDKGYKLVPLEVRDKKGNKIETSMNGMAPYAPRRFHFWMPKSDVTVLSKFEPEISTND